MDKEILRPEQSPASSLLTRTNLFYILKKFANLFQNKFFPAFLTGPAAPLPPVLAKVVAHSVLALLGCNKNWNLAHLHAKKKSYKVAPEVTPSIRSSAS